MDDNQVFDYLFSESDTYSIIPQILERACVDVSESEYDEIKDMSIIHHISGMTDIALSLSKCLDKLEKQSTILGIDLEESMDEEQYKKFVKIKQILEIL